MNATYDTLFAGFLNDIEAKKAAEEAIKAEHLSKIKAEENRKNKIEAACHAGVAELLTAKSHAVLFNKNNLIAKIDGIDLHGFHMDFYSKVPALKFEHRDGMEMGPRGVRRARYAHHRYPMKKDGTFNCEKIATEISNYVNNETARNKHEAEKKISAAGGKAALDELYEANGKPNGYWSDYSRSFNLGLVTVEAPDHGGLKVIVNSNHKETVEKVLEVLKALGLTAKKS